MVKRTEAIANFLRDKAKEDLAGLYEESMEVQVQVRTDQGEPVEGEHEGVRWKGYRDTTSGELWKDFRVPFANGTYEDKEMSFDLASRANAIGLTGWDYQAQVSRWVGFDIDWLVGHQKGLTESELDDVLRIVQDVPWVTTRRSKSGKGLHLYVHLAVPEPTASRAEHAALARAVLGQLCALTGEDLTAAVDKLGGVLWVWHRQTKPGGFDLVKQGVPLEEVPANWREHLHVVEGRASKQRSTIEEVDEVAGLVRAVRLDEQHKQLLRWFQTQPRAEWWWDQDRRMLVCHTSDLKLAHSELKFRGVFETSAQSAAGSGYQNCFAFPLRQGAWVVRRHGQGTAEHPSWTRDARGWTRCFFNRPADLATLAQGAGGVESSRGEFIFPSALKAFPVLKHLGATRLPDLLEGLRFRPAAISPHDAGRVLFTIDRDKNDPKPDGFLASKRGDRWETLVSIQGEASEGEPPDDLVRHVVAGGEDAGWFLRCRGTWVHEPRVNVTSTLLATGQFSRRDMEPTLGLAIANFWELVNLPFQDEYPGNRRWNRNAAKLAVTPREGSHPTWDRLLRHVGASLTPELLEMSWAIGNGVTSGLDYLQLWVASLFQEPTEPLPYLFFHGPQGSGKSSFHEALGTLFTSGYVRADSALTNSQRFNGELANAVLCVVEETNLRAHKHSYDRIKDWVTGRTISIHQKNKTPFDLPNATHWVQCSNHADHCPILPGDTRITMVYVAPLEEEVPKSELMQQLRQEAPAFLYHCLHLDLPKPVDRLRIPVVDTPDKRDQMAANRSELESFLCDECFEVVGALVRFDELFERFLGFLRPESRPYWSKRRFSRELPPRFPRGRCGAGGQVHVGNVSLVEMKSSPGPRLITVGDRLVREAT